MTLRKIIGAGGGGGKGGGGEQEQHVATEAPDSLRSRQYARVIDVVSEGEIGGLVDGLRSIYLDETPLQNADDSYNFSGVRVETRTGTQAQAYIPGFPSVESEIAVGAEIKFATPVTREISTPSVDAVRITVSIPQLTYQNTTNGDLSGTSVQIAIDLQSNGGGFVEKINDTISGKTTSKYQRNYRVELAGDGPWDIRIRRLTADSTGANVANKTWFDSYTEIVDAKLTYPNSALIGLEVSASQFRAVPRRGYEIYGIKVRLPSNYNPVTRAYTGIWDGTFSIAWSDNPAWCFYDLITSERYGIGSFVDASQVDKWAFYDIARYCDELVPDGFGGMEPRFTCNVYIQTQAEAYSLIAHFASIFAGVTFWSAGAITAVADKPSDAVMSFAPANVIDGTFTYSGSSLKARHTVALVTWNDPDDFYRQKIEYVEDWEGIAKYGVIQTEVVAFACTSRGQAHRAGRRILLTERMSTEMISFRCGLDGVYCAPGDVIQTIDPVRSGKRFGGRLLSGSVSSVTIDAPVDIESGKSYLLYCLLPDGTMESRAVSVATGSTSVLAVYPDFSAAPQAESMWVLSASDLVPEQWRIIGITEVEVGILEISGLAYRADKYDAIEQGLVLEPLQTSSIGSAPAAPTNVLLSESLYQTGSEVKARLSAAWDHVDAVKWIVSWRRGSGNFVISPTIDVASFTIDDALTGNYEMSVVALNALGRRSPTATVTLQVFGKTAPPVSVTGFSGIKVSGLALMSWDLSPDLDVRVGGRIVIRHSPLVSGATWEDGIIVDAFDGNTTTGTVALMTGTYLVKALDSSGNWSASAASFVMTEGMVTGWTTVGSSVQSPAFDGNKTGTALVDAALQIDSASTIAEMTSLISLWPKLSLLGGIADAGEYDFDATLDLVTVATRRFEADIAAASFDTGDVISARGLVSTWDSISGLSINDCDATLYASTTDDNPSGSPVWSAWTPFLVSDFTCRAARFRLLLESGSPTHNIAISTLRVDAKVPA